MTLQDDLAWLREQCLDALTSYADEHAEYSAQDRLRRSNEINRARVIFDTLGELITAATALAALPSGGGAPAYVPMQAVSINVFWEAHLKLLNAIESDPAIKARVLALLDKT